MPARCCCGKRVGEVFWEGADSLRVNPEGELVIATRLGETVQKRPWLCQDSHFPVTRGWPWHRSSSRRASAPEAPSRPAEGSTVKSMLARDKLYSNVIPEIHVKDIA